MSRENRDATRTIAIERAKMILNICRETSMDDDICSHDLTIPHQHFEAGGHASVLGQETDIAIIGQRNMDETWSVAVVAPTLGVQEDYGVGRAIIDGNDRWILEWAESVQGVIHHELFTLTQAEADSLLFT